MTDKKKSTTETKIWQNMVNLALNVWLIITHESTWKLVFQNILKYYKIRNIQRIKSRP